VTAPPGARSTDTAAGSNAAAGFNAAALAAPADADNSHEKFLAQGLRLLLTGNVNSARLLFERSAEGGNARAALLLGDSYDDVRLAQLGVEGVLPDRDKASYWYERADELGAPEAKERISEINAR
jgi:TPR repeat protein